MNQNIIIDLKVYAALTALRKQQNNLTETIAHLVELSLSQPENELRAELLEEISCLDSIADLMRQALDSVAPEQRKNSASESRAS